MTWDTDHAQHSGKNKSMLLIHAKETYEDKGKAVVYVLFKPEFGREITKHRKVWGILILSSIVFELFL